MNMDPGTIQTLWTLFAAAVFIGVSVWAWSGRAARAFREAEQLPFAEDGPEAGSTEEGRLR